MRIINIKFIFMITLVEGNRTEDFFQGDSNVSQAPYSLEQWNHSKYTIKLRLNVVRN